MANTFIDLTDTPSSYDETKTQVVITAGNNLDFATFTTNELVDVNTFGAYRPDNGDVLTWFGGVNEWRPALLDPYSAGNGLNKTNGTLNISTTVGGGLGANSSGVYIEPIVGIAGTYGNATHVPSFVVNDKGQITSANFVLGSFEVANRLTANHIRNIAGTAGQITVVGGTGVGANAVVNLVSSGVTPGTYGNATYSPIITVDTYGRVQNVDLVQNIGGGAGNGNVDYNLIATEAFKSILVAGQTTVSAESKDDTLTFVAGAGMVITTNAGTDTITFESSGGGASVTISDTAPIGPTAGDLWWDSVTGKLKIYYTDADSSQWVDASPGGGGGGASVSSSDTPPASSSSGDLWWDSSIGRLKIYYQDADSTQWVDASPTTTLSPVADLTDGQLTLPQSNVIISSGDGRITWNYTTNTLHVGNGEGGFSTFADLDDLTLAWDSANSNLSISGGNTVTLFDQSLDTTDTVTFNQVNTEDVTGANQLILSAGASGITASTNGNQQFNATSGSIFLVTPTVDAQTSAFLANTITANALTVNGQTITAYGNTEVQTYLNAQGYSNVDLDAQTLTWDSGNSNLSISGGNTVTLTGIGGGLNNVVEDTTPQLGGNLDINSQFITGALIPDTNNTYDLGTAELKWRDLYLNSGSIYLGDVVLSTVANVLQANVEGTLKNVSFGGDPVVTNSVKPETTNAEAVDGTVTNVTGGDAGGINSTGGDLVIDGGVGAIGNGSIKIGTVSTAAVDIGGASTTTTINGQTTFTNDARFDTGVEEQFSTINAATGTVVHDCDNGHVFRHTAPSANWTANFTNLGLTTSYATTVTLVIDQGVTARIPTAVQIGGVAQTLLWQGGSPPTGTSNGEDVVSFSILNSGGTYTVLGQLVGFS